MAFRNIGIYRDSETVRYHLGHFKNHTPNEWAIYDDLGHFFNSGHPINIGSIHLPYPFDSEQTQTKLDKLREFCDHVFVVGSELHDITATFIKNNDYQNVSYHICGELNFDLANAKVGYFMDWFETSRFFYRDYLPEIMQRFTTNPHDRKFDILLGRKKLHRDYVYDYVSNSIGPGQYIMSYFNDTNTNFSGGDSKWLWEQSGLKFDKPPEWTVESVNYYGHRMSLSQVIPLNIYNQTCYTIIAETNFSDEYSFYTEKTAKPIIAKRPFIMFAGRHYMRNLRKLGFKTFDGIINESYDEISDSLFRWGAAAEQIKWLTMQDPSMILEKAKPIVEHNFNVMMSKGWLNDYINDLESIIDKIVTSQCSS